MDQGSPSQQSQLDNQLFASLLPNLVNLYQLAAYGLDASRQLEIAKLAGSVRDSLEQAKKQAQSIPGGDLTLQEQEQLIAVLEREVAKRQTAVQQEDQSVTEQQKLE